MISYIFLVFLILQTSIFLSLLTQKRVERTLALTVLGLIAILYIFGLFNILNIGYYFVLMLFGFSIIGNVYLIIKKKFKLSANSWIGAAIFLLFTLFALYLNYNRALSRWDEFSHWGLAVKNTLQLGAFHNAPGTTVAFSEYPPATVLLQFFFVKFQQGYQEYSMYLGMNILYFSIMISQFANLDYKKNKLGAILLAAATLCFPLVLYGEFYQTLLVDGIIAVVFAAILIRYFYGKNDLLKNIEIFLLCFVVAITKTAGAGLAAIAIIAMIVDSIFFKKTFKSNKSFSDGFKKNAAYIFAALGLVIAKYSWSAYLSLNHVEITHPSGVSGIKDLLSIFNAGSLSGYRIETLANFKGAFISYGIKNLSAGGINISISPIMIITACIAVFCIFIFTNKDKSQRKRSIAFFAILTCGFFVYLYSLSTVYLFSFSPYEAVRLASYARYLNTYFLGLLLIIGAVAANNISKSTFSKLAKAIFIGIFAAIVAFVAVDRYDVFLRSSVAETVENSEQYNAFEQQANDLDHKNSCVYFISIADMGYDYQMSKYRATPLSLNSQGDSWSIGIQPQFEGDVWTDIVTLDEWINILKTNEYTHVYIYKYNDDFKNVYGSIFENEVIEEDTLYLIDYSQDLALVKAN